MKTVEVDKLQNSTHQTNPSDQHTGKLSNQSLSGSKQAGAGDRKWLIRSVVVGLIVAGAGAMVFSLQKAGHNPAAKSKDGQLHAPVLTVSVQNPQFKPIERKLAVHGSVSAWDPISIGATTSGLQVEKILVDEGQTVKKGQLLATLDSSQLNAQLQSEKARLASAIATVSKSVQPNRPEDINSMTAAVSQAEANVSDTEAALVQAKANFENAEANIKRYVFLKKEGVVSNQEAEGRETTAQVDAAIVRSAEHRVTSAKFALKQAQEKLSMAHVGGRREDIDIAKASVKEIEGNVQRLQTQIAQTLIKAPVDGLLTRRDVHLGDISTSGKTMFYLSRDNRLELKAQVPESDLQFIKPGEIVAIDNTLGTAAQITGTVREISPLIDADLRLATVRIDVPTDKGLKSGMYAEGHINVGKYSALTVPSQAIISRDEKSTVFVLHNDQVERRLIQAGNRVNDDVEIISGLNNGEQVVVDGAGFLKDADYVAVSKH
jgi:HlyD family secretion protein